MMDALPGRGTVTGCPYPQVLLHGLCLLLEALSQAGHVVYQVVLQILVHLHPGSTGHIIKHQHAYGIRWTVMAITRAIKKEKKHGYEGNVDDNDNDIRACDGGGDDGGGGGNGGSDSGGDENESDGDDDDGHDDDDDDNDDNDADGGGDDGGCGEMVMMMMVVMVMVVVVPVMVMLMKHYCMPELMAVGGQALPPQQLGVQQSYLPESPLVASFHGSLDSSFAAAPAALSENFAAAVAVCDLIGESASLGRFRSGWLKSMRDSLSSMSPPTITLGPRDRGEWGM